MATSTASESQRERDAEQQELLGLIARCVAASRRDIAVIKRVFVGIRIVGVVDSNLRL
jgi:hypothetical protein